MKYSMEKERKNNLFIHFHIMEKDAGTVVCPIVSPQILADKEPQNITLLEHRIFA